MNRIVKMEPIVGLTDLNNTLQSIFGLLKRHCKPPQPVNLLFFAETMSSVDFCGCVKIMLIPMSASLGVTILVIIVHFYDRYGFRRQRRRQRLILCPLAPIEVNLSHESPRTGLDQSIIDLLPKFAYKASHRRWLGYGEAVQCTCCISTIVEADRVRLLPICKHLFHVDCIDRWLRLRATCPNCRAEPRPQHWMVRWVWWH